MAERKKIIPTWMKVTAFATLVTPFMVRLERDKESGRLESVTSRSLAFKVSYTPAKDGNASSIDITVPGIGCDCCGVKAGGKTYTVNGEKIAKGAKHVCDEIGDKVKHFAKKACDVDVSVGEDTCGCFADEAETEDMFCTDGSDSDIFAAEAEAAEKAAEEAVLSEQEEKSDAE